MSEKKFRQLPVIDFRYDGLEEPLSYIRTGCFHPKVPRHIVSVSRKLGIYNGVAESQKQIRIKKVMTRSKSRQKDLVQLKPDAPFMFESIRNYLLHNRICGEKSPKVKFFCDTLERSFHTDRPKSSLAVIKKLKYDRSTHLALNSAKDHKNKIKRSGKIQIIIKSPDIEL